VPPGEVLHAKGDRGRQTSVVCQLHAEAVRSFLDEDFEWSERRLEASLDIRDADLRGLVLRLGKEACHPGFASAMLAEQIAGQMAIELFRYQAAIGDDPVRGGLAPWRLRIIDERLADLRAAPTLAELAALCDLSPRQLTRSFRASRDCSIGEYVAQSQVERAKRLLTTEESIKSIASSLGFRSPASFSTAFRRATGQAPSEFRQSARASRIPVGPTPYGRY
jgi:AraC family transcriptional regulator